MNVASNCFATARSRASLAAGETRPATGAPLCNVVTDTSGWLIVFIALLAHWRHRAANYRAYCTFTTQFRTCRHAPGTVRPRESASNNQGVQQVIEKS
ncbi:hypothetical protein [Rhodopila globiformis]|uniref:hypothetical protein n=1 Tax=Rhodopila globiformis TaxID=1071 RepID=UPI0011B00EFC|nr:hypothetical protein [Rhodopila globiformis]